MKRFLLVYFSVFFLVLPLIAGKPNLLLLKVYKDQDITGWVMSEKLDGIRAYWNGKELLSRGGKIIYAPKWFLVDYPPFAIDGELWTKRGDFENISSIVRDKIPNEKDWEQITHNIFEVPCENRNLNLSQRLALVKPYQNKIIKIIPQINIKNKADLKKYLKKIELYGGEGVVVRDPLSPYIAKRTSKALKVKSFEDAECEVIGYTKSKSKQSKETGFKDMIGAIICELPNHIVFKIGSGLSDDDRVNLPLKVKIGSIITFKYTNWTKYGKPRFPIYLRVKEYNTK